eukprot:1378946-Pyramimonas_sp.AAC.3
MVRTVNIYTNNRPAELSELVNNWAKWRKVGQVALRPGQLEAKVELLVPVAASNVMVEFDTFHVSLQAAAQEVLQVLDWTGLDWTGLDCALRAPPI